MEIWWMYPILGSFLLSLTLVKGMRRFAYRHGIVDRPLKPRKKHKHAIPLGGGIGIFAAFFVITALVELSTGHFTMGEIGYAELGALLAGSSILMILGYLDDKYDLPPRVTIWGAILAALIASIAGIGFQKVSNPFGDIFYISEMLSSLFTFLWLMGMMYTTKLLDGLDGLVSSIGFIASIIISALALSAAFYQPDVALMALIAAAAILGFFIWNAPPASIFLGDGGSLFVGYLIGVLAIISGSKVFTALLVMAIPVIDVVFVIVQRLRRGKSLVKGDRLHLHHRLSDYGWKTSSILILYASIALLFGLSTLILSGLQKLIALIILFTMMLIGITFLNIYEKN